MEKVIKVIDLLNSISADDDEKGNKVFNSIVNSANEKYDNIILNFEGISLINTAFLNNAMGKICGLEEFESGKVNVKVANFPKEAIELLREVLKTASEKYSK
ncbi:hypothetical protein CPAST_c06420 [Clostridium pasteurianum DSM 525 = ATCC 6013]|uniref:DUF4325 domain-containing protein n=1 Tax=Clostridium pasteurianum DSM 525 = ATCC 6013 TaxID=1262449 RepID=A0A0H3J1Z2_CLOPA|nr:DUF4325 domain-containing protein [Clostridium pasteurianum]AJA46742.1 hypothetical protein CPAST_c06420 [Clostridium pasteurianum DSM 525 = ATCC 6013]AJA50730.1 hypothetical protein CLPA_c06420 [Clostridium pasteurianum DSM 525 = ATCC 6013]AOZ74141.1 hypothetical protein AQ983_03085 [Clostridium pasteurianum DSM 525 = ATCC 6013]AOZ77938.1 hypothetical protein AQ984_03085 [Clostridium pasteurianum]ELP61308.1 hypothetical protein F502_02595 [Clostridium pasteurianum DSM 525 = ATCC 6013]